MIGLLQRVLSADVSVGGESVATIEQGILVFVGIEKNDTQVQAQRLVERVLGYRVFADRLGKMNLSVIDMGGGALLVPQFTLVADTDRGMRPSFSNGCPPSLSAQLFECTVTIAKKIYPDKVKQGVFGADMQVSLVNDGPVTFTLTSR